MATFNRAHFIGESLDSILAQTFPDWECLIIDDGSTDDTAEFLKSYLEDNRIHYFKRPSSYKKGLPGCRNYGLELAQGDYIAFFDDDDIVHPDNLQHCVSTLSNSSYAFCRYIRTTFSGPFNIVHDRNDKFSSFEISKDDMERILKHQLSFNSCTLIWTRQCFQKEKFDEDLMYAEEWELYSRILSNNVKGISLDKILFYGRKHPNSNTGEFWNHDPIRRSSKVKAIMLVIDNLKAKGLLTKSLVKYFVQLGFFLNESIVVKYTLNKSNAGIIKKIKYNWGFQIYPMIRPFLRLKGKILSTKQRF